MNCAWSVGRPRLLGELRAAAAELIFQAVHNAGVHLAHATFRQPERVADLLHRQFLIIIEDDDQPLVAIQALGDQLH